METVLPDVFAQFVAVAERLERHYRDMQDVEFTVERGKLWMLQTRTGKRTARAALRIAVEMARRRLDHAKPRRCSASTRLARPIASPDHRARGGA